jgi:hypothetical protein
MGGTSHAGATGGAGGTFDGLGLDQPLSDVNLRARLKLGYETDTTLSLTPLDANTNIKFNSFIRVAVQP